MEHVIASCPREFWHKKDWIFEARHGFQPGLSCESQVIAVCQDIADSLDNGGRTDTIITDFPKAFDLVPHDRLLRKIVASIMEPTVFVWIREFQLGRT
jgi:hypothetical protein